MAAALEHLTMLLDALTERSARAAPSREEVVAQLRVTAERSMRMSLERRYADKSEEEKAAYWAQEQRTLQEVIDRTTEEWVTSGARHGNAALQPLFSQMMDELHGLAREIGFVSGEVPTFGVLPIGTPNALALCPPGSTDTLVVFQEGLPLFLNRITKLAIAAEMAVPVDEWERVDFDSDDWEPAFAALIDQSLEGNPDLSLRLVELLVATLILNNPNLARAHVVDDAVSAVRAVLLANMERFIIAHELGHIALGHLAADAPRRALAIAGQPSVALTPQQADELKADVLGFSLLDLHVRLHARNESYEAYGFVAPDFFFSCISVLENAMSRYGSPWAESNTHPPATARREQRRAQLRELNPGAVILGRRLQVTLQRLEAAALPDLQTFLEAGGEIAASWAVCPKESA